MSPLTDSKLYCIPTKLPYMVNYSLLSGTTDGSIYIHDILTPVGVADYKCPLITSIRGRYDYKETVTSVIWFLL